MTGRRQSLRDRRHSVAVVLVLPFLLLTGCGSGEAEVRAQRATTDGIQATLAERADVLRAEVFYQDNFTASRIRAAAGAVSG